jgi:hypothetical protein
MSNRPLLLMVPLCAQKELVPVSVAVPATFSVRPISCVPPLYTQSPLAVMVNVAPEAIVVAPLPLNVPFAHVIPLVTVMLLLPCKVPLPTVRLCTVTSWSTVTVPLLMMAVSVLPGTALHDQCPLVLQLSVEPSQVQVAANAARGGAANAPRPNSSPNARTNRKTDLNVHMLFLLVKNELDKPQAALRLPSSGSFQTMPVLHYLITTGR